MHDAAALPPPQPSSPARTADQPRLWTLALPQRLLTHRDIAALTSLRPRTAVMYWVAGSRVLNAAPSTPQPGATLVLENLHEYFLPARRLAAYLGEVLGRTVRINAYATPGNARGFAAHSHGTPSVLLQQAGSRKWLVAPPPTPQPQPRMRRHCDPPALTAAQREQARAAATPFWLHPGQVLYLPAGWLHWGSTGPQPSLHLGIEWDGPPLGTGRMWPPGP